MNDSVIIAEFDDLMSGRIPQWIETTAKYPRLQKEQHHWRQPFKEGGNVGEVDEMTMRISTIMNGHVFSEEYKWWWHSCPSCVNMEVWVERMLKTKIHEVISNCYLFYEGKYDK